MNKICLSCPILSSCQHKYSKPTKCPHKPAQIGTNLSNAFASIGRKRIAISGGGSGDMARLGNEEHLLRMSAGEGAWD